MLIVFLILFQICIFIGLIFILRLVMTNNISSATKHIEELNQDCVKKEQEINKQLQEAAQKSQQLLANAKEEAEKSRAQIIKDANAQREELLQQARQESERIIQQADKSRQQLIQEINERIAMEAVDRACELIERTLPEQFRQDVHSLWVDELIKNGFSGLSRLRIEQDNRQITLISAFGLNEEERDKLSKKLNEAAGFHVSFKEEIDPKVVAGIIINIGSLVLDGSLKNKIQETAKSIKCSGDE